MTTTEEMMRAHEEHASQCDGSCFERAAVDPAAVLLRALGAAVAAFPQAWWIDPRDPCDVMATTDPDAPRGYPKDSGVADCRDPAVAALLIATRDGISALVAQRDAAHAARVRAEAEVDGRGRDLAAAATDRDALRSLLAAAARGELPRCSRAAVCERLATREGNWRWACDEHGEGLDDLPHAAALRAAMGGAT